MVPTALPDIIAGHHAITFKKSDILSLTASVAKASARTGAARYVFVIIL